MSEAQAKLSLGIAVGSASTQVCSVGAFARAEIRGLEKLGVEVIGIEPNGKNLREFPPTPEKQNLTHIILHIPSLFDRVKPWNVLATVTKIRWLYPGTKIVVTLHEYSEAPKHWRLRAQMATLMSDAVVVHSEADFESVKKWKKRALRLRLGPTMWDEHLLANPIASEIKTKRARARESVSGFLPQRAQANSAWLLHPGLVTPGKGVEFLLNWIDWQKETNNQPVDYQFVLMGGIGPKERDRQFAAEAVTQFQQRLGDRFTFLNSPTDAVYQSMLLASDLVAFPFDAGVSERRSTFLAACSSGANVWSTTGKYSDALNLGLSGAYQVPTTDAERAFVSLNEALRLSENGDFERRVRNLEWAKERSWEIRNKQLVQFLSEL